MKRRNTKTGYWIPKPVVYFIISMNMEPQRGSTKVPWSFRKSSNDSKNQFVSLIDVTAATAKIKQAIGKPSKK